MTTAKIGLKNLATEDTLKELSGKFDNGVTVDVSPVLDAIADGTQKAQMVDAEGNNIPLATSTKQSDGSQKGQLVDEQGRNIRLQVATFGVVSGLGEDDFSLDNDHPFLVKNDNEEPTTLEVMPAGGDSYVETTFAVGWNPELVIAIKTNESAGNLVWGY